MLIYVRHEKMAMRINIELLIKCVLGCKAMYKHEKHKFLHVVLVCDGVTRGVSKYIFLHSRHAESTAMVPSLHRPSVYRFGVSLVIVTTADGRGGRKIGGKLAPRIHPSLSVSRN
jgi:hypothetical protein